MNQPIPDVCQNCFVCPYGASQSRVGIVISWNRAGKLGSAGRANCRKQWKAGRFVRVVHIAFYRPLAGPVLKAQVALGRVMELHKPRRGCKYSHRNMKTGRSN